MSNAEQIEYWNGEAGKRWAQDDDTMARLLQPVTEALLDHAAVEGCKHALDVGCGGGSQSVMLAQRLGEDAQVLGVDISGPMLAVAAAKAEAPAAGRATLRFAQADASAHDFEPNSFDLVFSRFGVMFFDDPEGAFSNIRKGMQPQAKLAFCCWQPVKDNAWTWIPLQAALQHLPPPERMPPNAPGPFALADAERTRGILANAGFDAIDLQAYRPTLQIGKAPSLGEAVRELARIGPVARLLTGQPEAVLARVFPAMETALAPYYKDGALQLSAAIWLVTAHNPG
ncbi:class I SAM-dependent methyltransferase [Pseudomonadota bacterium]